MNGVALPSVTTWLAPVARLYDTMVSTGLVELSAPPTRYTMPLISHAEARARGTASECDSVKVVWLVGSNLSTWVVAPLLLGWVHPPKSRYRHPS